MTIVEKQGKSENGCLAVSESVPVHFNPFLTSQFFSLVIWISPFVVLEVSGGCVHFYCILHRNYRKQC